MFLIGQPASSASSKFLLLLYRATGGFRLPTPPKSDNSVGDVVSHFADWTGASTNLCPVDILKHQEQYSGAVPPHLGHSNNKNPKTNA
jgi:hypothetical protein